MGRKRNDPLTQAVKALGLSNKEFAAKLGLQYATYMHRLRTGCWPMACIHQILFFTGRPFNELWPNPLLPVPQKIQLNLAAALVSNPVPKVPAFNAESDYLINGVPLPADYVESSELGQKRGKKKPEPLQLRQDPPANGEEPKKPQPSPSSFTVEDVYEGGLPPVE